MSKTNFFVKSLKNINKLINNLLEKNLNKLKFKNLINLLRNNKIVLTFVALFFFYFYLIYYYQLFINKNEISKKLKNELVEKNNLNFKFSKNIKYNFFPRPHFKIKNSSISFDQNKISKIEKIKNLYFIRKFFFH